MKAEHNDELIVQYNTNVDLEELSHNTTWEELVPMVLEIARGITTDVVSSASEGHVTMFKPTICIPHRLLQVRYEVTH